MCLGAELDPWTFKGQQYDSLRKKKADLLEIGFCERLRIPDINIITMMS